MTVLTLAYRNIRRHDRQTVVIGITIILASFILTFGNAYGESILKVMTDRLTDFFLGHLTVHAQTQEGSPNFLENRFPPLSNSAQILQALQSNSMVAAISPRLKWIGMLINGEQVQNVVIVGVDPAREKKVAPAQGVVEGRWLEATDQEGILVSQTMMRQFNWQVGDEVSLMTTASDGYLSGLSLKIVGVLKPNGFDYFTRSQVIISRTAAATLTYLPESGNELTVRLHNPRNALHLKKLFQSRIASLGGLIQTNQEFAPLLWSIASANKFPWRVISGVILVLVILGILITMVASVLERIPEFGAMLAMGYPYRYLQRLIYSEVLLLGFGAATIGVGLALLMVALFHQIGLPAFMKLLVLSYGGERLYLTTSLFNPVIVLVIVVLTALIAGIYPGRLIKRLNPIEALRAN